MTDPELPVIRNALNNCILKQILVRWLMTETYMYMYIIATSSSYIGRRKPWFICNYNLNTKLCLYVYGLKQKQTFNIMNLKMNCFLEALRLLTGPFFTDVIQALSSKTESRNWKPEVIYFKIIYLFTQYITYFHKINQNILYNTVKI